MCWGRPKAKSTINFFVAYGIAREENHPPIEVAIPETAHTAFPNPSSPPSWGRRAVLREPAVGSLSDYQQPWLLRRELGGLETIVRVRSNLRIRRESVKRSSLSSGLAIDWRSDSLYDDVQK